MHSQLWWLRIGNIWKLTWNKWFHQSNVYCYCVEPCREYRIIKFIEIGDWARLWRFFQFSFEFWNSLHVHVLLSSIRLKELMNLCEFIHIILTLLKCMHEKVNRTELFFLSLLVEWIDFDNLRESKKQSFTFWWVLGVSIAPIICWFYLNEAEFLIWFFFFDFIWWQSNTNMRISNAIKMTRVWTSASLFIPRKCVVVVFSVYGGDFYQIGGMINNNIQRWCSFLNSLLFLMKVIHVVEVLSHLLSTFRSVSH